MNFASTSKNTMLFSGLNHGDFSAVMSCPVKVRRIRIREVVINADKDTDFRVHFYSKTAALTADDQNSEGYEGYLTLADSVLGSEGGATVRHFYATSNLIIQVPVSVKDISIGIVLENFGSADDVSGRLTIKYDILAAS